MSEVDAVVIGAGPAGEVCSGRLAGKGLEVTLVGSIGGMLTSTIYVLFMIPCLFAIGQDIRAVKQRRAA